jgi:integrase
MPKRLPKGCCEDTDRHGNIRVYYRVHGRPKVRLRAVPWTPEFMEEYESAKNATPIRASTQYFSSIEFKQLKSRTQQERRWILESTFDEPIAPGATKLFKDFPLAKMKADAIEVLRDRKFKTPQAANARVKNLKVVFKWAAKKRLIDSNPSINVERVRVKSDGIKAWTLDDVKQFELRHPIGSKARLALALLLYTGQRRGDVVRFGKQHCKNGKLIFTEQKTGKRLKLPILPELQTIIDASPCGSLTFLESDWHRPFNPHGFSDKFRVWCKQAGLKNLSAHGLRKASATFIANAGGSSHMLMAAFGWSTLAMAEHYTKSADQERLAEQAMNLLRPTNFDSGTKSQKK